MPKIHDACQTLLEELCGKARQFRADEAVYALTLSLHALEEDLVDRHPEGAVIVGHLWQVFEQDIAPRYPAYAFQVDPARPPLEEDNYWLCSLIQQAVWEGRRFFPYKKAII